MTLVRTHVSRSLIDKILLQDVYIPRGGLLFEKQHKLTEEDLEFLIAFNIDSVVIESPKEEESVKPKADEPSTKEEPRAASATGDANHDFLTLYEFATKFMEKTMREVGSGLSIPVMEIRQWLKPMIDYVNRPSGWILALQSNQGSSRYTYSHMVSVALISAIIARANRFAEADIMQIALAGLLSDIGKSKIDQKILHKAGSLNSDEYDEIKKHTIYGYQIIKNVKGLSDGVALAALQHHERLDGSGYPLGSKGDKIHTFAKIVAIADVMHAMSSMRVYRVKESPIQAIEYIRYEGVGKFDPGLVHTFIRSITQLPLGTMVRLNDGRLGRMIYVDPSHPTRPMVDVDGEIIPLAQNNHLFIEEIIVKTS